MQVKRTLFMFDLADKEIFTVQECAFFMSVCVNTVRNYIKARRAASSQNRRQRAYLYPQKGYYRQFKLEGASMDRELLFLFLITAFILFLWVQGAK